MKQNDSGFAPHIIFACLPLSRPLENIHRDKVSITAEGFMPVNTAQSKQLCAGFTLVEVIIALVLLSVGTLALLNVLLGGFSQRETSREYDVARNAAFAKLEEIRGHEFASVYTTYNNTYFAISELTPPTGWTNPGKITISNAVSDLYDITITIRWRIKGNANASVYNEYITRSLLTRGAKY